MNQLVLKEKHAVVNTCAALNMIWNNSYKKLVSQHPTVIQKEGVDGNHPPPLPVGFQINIDLMALSLFLVVTQYHVNERHLTHHLRFFSFLKGQEIKEFDTK